MSISRIRVTFRCDRCQATAEVEESVLMVAPRSWAPPFGWSHDSLRLHHYCMICTRSEKAKNYAPMFKNVSVRGFGGDAFGGQG